MLTASRAYHESPQRTACYPRTAGSSVLGRQEKKAATGVVAEFAETGFRRPLMPLRGTDEGEHRQCGGLPAI
jgi:hypothetical protein